jgi:ATP-dependent helicase/nuclease subunit B
MNAKGFTRPSIFNDDIIIKGLKEAGVSEQDANYYIHSTCVEIVPIGTSNVWVASKYINFNKIFEYLLNDGKQICEGEGLEFFTPFDSDYKKLDTFEKFYDEIKKIVDNVLKEFKSNIMTSTNKMKQLSVKLKKLIKRVIWTIVLQIKSSEFEVVASEFEFGKGKEKPAIEIELEEGRKVLLSGKIDRIDIAKTEEGKFIRIIDYKSYSKEMKLFNVYSGLEVQLITYMDAVDELETLPGGMLYLKLDNPMIKTEKDMTEEDIEDEIRKSLRMNGMIVANTRLIKAMDTEMIEESQNLNLKIKGEKTTGKTYVPSEEEFEKLRFHVRKTLREICEEIVKGNIKNQPTKCGGKTPCAYCDYKVICRFDRNLGNEFKYLKEMKKEEVWEQLKLE